MITEAKSEIWKDITGYESVYKISNTGKIESYKNKKKTLLSPSIGGAGYFYLSLSNGGKRKTHSLHRLLAEHFISNPENKRTVNHKNGIKTDNRLENLEWATDSENNKHAFDCKLRNPRKSVIPVVAIQDTSILEFDSVKECAKYFGVITRTVRQAYSHPCKCRGHNIYRA